jgi:murein DD-endopeptidase MepM/ murein hydrolase activator NlpD
MTTRKPRLPGPVTLAAAWALLAAGCAHEAAPLPSAPGPFPRSLPARSPAPALLWPVEGRVLSGFGNRRATHVHQGLDLGVPRGTPVRAAAAGRVVYSGRMRGYGNVVIIAHENRIETVYAHNRSNRVGKGERVGRGQLIAESGASGNATTPHLHFEVRENRRARDPLRYLPRSYPAAPRR